MHSGSSDTHRKRRAVITLRVTINGDASVFDVATVHKKRGTIAERPFEFGDYLSIDMAHRKDQRPDYTGGMYASRIGGPLHWYISEPKTTRPLTRVIEAHIDARR